MSNGLVYKYVIDMMRDAAGAMLLCYGCYASGLRYKLRAEYALYVMSDRGRAGESTLSVRVLHIIRCRLVVRGVGTRRRGKGGVVSRTGYGYTVWYRQIETQSDARTWVLCIRLWQRCWSPCGKKGVPAQPRRRGQLAVAGRNGGGGDGEGWGRMMGCRVGDGARSRSGSAASPGHLAGASDVGFPQPQGTAAALEGAFYAMEEGFVAANGGQGQGQDAKEGEVEGDDHQRQVLHNVLKQ